MSKFFDELKRRNVIKATIAYVVVAWVFLQVASIVLPIVNAPEWVLKTFSFFLVLGFPLWVLVSWIYEVTPEGLKRTQKNTEERGISETTDKRLSILILVGLVAVIAITLLKPNTGTNYSDRNTEYAIAVLPFDDMSSEGDTEWFCDGIKEDIYTLLSGIKGLKVISPKSTERFKDSDSSIPEIAQELGVSYLVDGSVRKDEDDILINARLINHQDENLWADSFNEKLKDVFKVQADVSRQIAQQLKIKITPEVKQQFDEFPTDNMNAYEAYLKGNSFLSKLSKDDAAIAVNFFKQAIAFDPNYAEAYAALGFAYFSTNIPENKILGRQNIENALEINPNSAIANANMGVMLCAEDENNEEGYTYLIKALELNPNEPRVHGWLSVYYAHFRTLDNADVNLENAVYHNAQAILLDPYDLQFRIHNIRLLLLQDKIEEAEEVYNSYKTQLQKPIKNRFALQILDRRIRESRNNGDPPEEEIRILDQALADYPFIASYIYRRLGGAHDRYYNDNKMYLEYTAKALVLDSLSGANNLEYHAALVENGLFDKADKIRFSANYKNQVSISNQLNLALYHHYLKGDYEEALQIVNDTSYKASDSFKTTRKIFIYAKAGRKEEAYDLLQSHAITHANKVVAFAILEDRDSMYYHLNHPDLSPSGAGFPNSRHELDPYRQDPRYLEFLKKKKFPVDKQKN